MCCRDYIKDAVWPFPVEIEAERLEQRENEDFEVSVFCVYLSIHDICGREP